jgi:site-specific DNA-adenine methylase
MFSYYGSKSKIVDYYPPPKHKRIIEPFAGSARYSLKYWQNDVLLEVWNYLKNASEQDILKLPELKIGESLDNYTQLSDIEKKFLGFVIAKGGSSPRKKASMFATSRSPGRTETAMGFELKKTAKNLFKIKHWEIKLADYNELLNEEATWFIDPPYQFGGHVYRYNKIDYTALSEWCKTRKGQAIVCENTKADWLSFMPVTKFKGCMFETVEAIWSNHKTNYDNVQVSLFEGM